VVDRAELLEVDEALRLVERLRERIEHRRDLVGRMWCIQAEEALSTLRADHIRVVLNGKTQIGVGRDG
jgi:hypothetical protein